jgi:choline dehydrogenase-like flavoprotein
MGMPSDEMAVVDTDLKVRGFENLRIVDGSIMPTIITGNTNTPIIAFAEKAADLVLNRTHIIGSTDLQENHEQSHYANAMN